MKIAISSKGKTLESKTDQRFGRAEIFIIYDTDNDTFEVWENPNVSGAHGVGMKTSQDLANMGVKTIITGHVCPKAFGVLDASKIEMYQNLPTVQETIDGYKEGNLAKINEAGESHH